MIENTIWFVAGVAASLFGQWLAFQDFNKKKKLKPWRTCCRCGYTKPAKDFLFKNTCKYCASKWFNNL